MYVNGKMRPVELFQEWLGEWWRGDILGIVRTFVNAAVYPYPAQQ
jgi:hypothetical protein